MRHITVSHLRPTPVTLSDAGGGGGAPAPGISSGTATPPALLGATVGAGAGVASAAGSLGAASLPRFSALGQAVSPAFAPISGAVVGIPDLYAPEDPEGGSEDEDPEPAGGIGFDFDRWIDWWRRHHPEDDPYSTDPPPWEPLPPPDFPTLEDPRQVCGADVTDRLVLLAQKVKTYFWRPQRAALGLPVDVRRDVDPQGARTVSACEDLIQVPSVVRAWDILELHRYSRGDPTSIELFNKTNGCEIGHCGTTVWVDGACWLAGSVNYVLYGWLMRLCGYSRLRTWLNSRTWNLIDPRFGPAQNYWADLGYNGWGLETMGWDSSRQQIVPRKRTIFADKSRSDAAAGCSECPAAPFSGNLTAQIGTGGNIILIRTNFPTKNVTDTDLAESGLDPLIWAPGVGPGFGTGLAAGEALLEGLGLGWP